MQKRAELIKHISGIISSLTKEEKKIVVNELLKTKGIPISVFKANLSALEIITKYLKEVENKSYSHLALFEYDEEKETWREIKTIASNTSLSYVEIEIKGGYKLLRLDESLKDIIQLTYKFLPVVSIFTILMIIIISITITKNQKVAKYVKSKYG